MNDMKTLFQELVSTEQKRLMRALEEKGGVDGLRNNDNLRALVEEETSLGKPSSQPKVKRSDVDLDADNLRNDIFEPPNAAIDSNWRQFTRKFEAQKNQIITELTHVVQHENDRVIREVHGNAHERIRDQVGFQLLACRLAVPIIAHYSFVVNSRDLGRNGGYDAITPAVECTKLISYM
jgi:hypothetical protein